MKAFITTAFTIGLLMVSCSVSGLTVQKNKKVAPTFHSDKAATVVEPAWSFEVSNFTDSIGNLQNVGSMTVHEDYVFFSMFQTVHCYHFPTGKKLWESGVLDWATGHFKPAVVASEGVLIVADSLSCLVAALDLNTGKTQWSKNVQGCRSGGLQINMNPLVYNLKGSSSEYGVVISAGDDGQATTPAQPTKDTFLVSYKVSDGHKLWQTPNNTGFNQPTGEEDILLVNNSIIYTWTMFQQIYVNFSAWDVHTGEMLWTKPRASTAYDGHLSRLTDYKHQSYIPGVQNETIYILQHKVGVTSYTGTGLGLALNPFNGSDLWPNDSGNLEYECYLGIVMQTIHLDNKNGGFYYQNEDVYGGQDNVSLSITKVGGNYPTTTDLRSDIDAGSVFQNPQQIALPSIKYSADNGVIVASNYHEVYGVDVKTGSKLWTSPFGGAASQRSSAVVMTEKESLVIAPVTLLGSNKTSIAAWWVTGTPGQ